MRSRKKKDREREEEAKVRAAEAVRRREETAFGDIFAIRHTFSFAMALDSGAPVLFTKKFRPMILAQHARDKKGWGLYFLGSHPLFHRSSLLIARSHQFQDSKKPCPFSTLSYFMRAGKRAWYSPCHTHPGRFRGRARRQIPKPAEGLPSSGKIQDGRHNGRIHIRLGYGVVRASQAKGRAREIGQARYLYQRNAFARAR